MALQSASSTTIHCHPNNYLQLVTIDSFFARGLALNQSLLRVYGWIKKPVLAKKYASPDLISKNWMVIWLTVVFHFESNYVKHQMIQKSISNFVTKNSKGQCIGIFAQSVFFF